MVDLAPDFSSQKSCVASEIASGEVHPLLPYASHVHARGGAPNRLQATVDENTIAFEGIVHRLRDRKYRGFVAVEYVWTEWHQCNRADNVSETILMRNRLEELIKNFGHRGRQACD